MLLVRRTGLIHVAEHARLRGVLPGILTEREERNFGRVTPAFEYWSYQVVPPGACSQAVIAGGYRTRPRTVSEWVEILARELSTMTLSIEQKNLRWTTRAYREVREAWLTEQVATSGAELAAQEATLEMLFRRESWHGHRGRIYMPYTPDPQTMAIAVSNYQNGAYILTGTPLSAPKRVFTPDSL